MATYLWIQATEPTKQGLLLENGKPTDSSNISQFSRIQQSAAQKASPISIAAMKHSQSRYQIKRTSQLTYYESEHNNMLEFYLEEKDTSGRSLPGMFIWEPSDYKEFKDAKAGLIRLLAEQKYTINENAFNELLSAKEKNKYTVKKEFKYHFKKWFSLIAALVGLIVFFFTRNQNGK